MKTLNETDIAPNTGPPIVSFIFKKNKQFFPAKKLNPTCCKLCPIYVREGLEQKNIRKKRS